MEHFFHLAHEAFVRLAAGTAVVAIGHEEVAKEGRVRQGLEDAVHEAGVSLVYKTAETLTEGVETLCLWCFVKRTDGGSGIEAEAFGVLAQRVDFFGGGNPGFAQGEAYA